MRSLQITLFILGMITIGTQTFRHVYIKWIEPTGSVLDEYREPVEEEIALSEDLDELLALYDEAHNRVQAAGTDVTQPENPFQRSMREPYRSEQRIRRAIEQWEAQSKRVFELYFYWMLGLASITGGLVAYTRINRWLGMVGIITGFTEMAWWTSPLLRTFGPQGQFERLLSAKLVLSLISAGLLVALWLLMEKRRRTMAVEKPA